MSWLRAFGRAFAKTFETSMKVVDKVDEKIIDPVLGEKVEEKLFGETLDKKVDKAVDEFNIGREEVRNERKAANCKGNPQKRCCGESECSCGDSDSGWLEVR